MCIDDACASTAADLSEGRRPVRRLSTCPKAADLSEGRTGDIRAKATEVQWAADEGNRDATGEGNRDATG